MKKKIIFVDDDRFFARLYRDSLEREFEVVVCYDALTAIKHFKSDTALVAAVVDVMMPAPEAHKDECHDGNTTGLWMLRQCIDEINSRRIAILLFTHLGVKYVKDEMTFLELSPEITDISSKAAVLADDLPLLVSKLVSHR